MNSRSARVQIEEVRCERCYSSRLNTTRRVLSRGGVLEIARLRPAGALMAHHPAWVEKTNTQQILFGGENLRDIQNTFTLALALRC